MPLPKKNLPKLGDSNNKKNAIPLPEINEEITTPIINNENDGEFSQLTEEEVFEEDKNDDRQAEEFDEQINEDRNEYVQSKIKSKGQAPLFDDPFEPGSEQEYDDDQYVDKKKFSIIPFGGKKSKSKGKNFARAKDFDDRKNTLNLVRILRLFMIIVILGLFGFGLKNTFFPSHVYTQEDIASIAQQAIGETGFPTQRGEAFAEQFAEAYFSFNSEDVNSRKLLNTFYATTTSKDNSITTVGANNQVVLVTPKVFNTISVNENVTNYTVNTLVSDRQGRTYDDNGNLVAHWVGLSITVYYDSKTDDLSVAEGSPQLLPSYSIGTSESQPQSEALGTGQLANGKYSELQPTINGFLRAYAASSSSSHADVNQYVLTDPDPELFVGFDGDYTVSTETLNRTDANVYPVSDSDSNNEWKVDLTVTWNDSTNEDTSSTLSFTGRYVLTIQQSSDGTYFVTAFRPFIYVPSNQASQ